MIVGLFADFGQSDEVDPEIVKNQARLESHAGKEKFESGSQDEGIKKEINSTLSHAVSDRLNLARASGKEIESTCQGYNSERVVLKASCFPEPWYFC